MASRWMREVNFTQSPPNAGRDAASKFICYFLRHVLGYTNFSESLGGSGHYDTHEKNGTNGVFIGGNLRFKDDVASTFAAGDVNKWLLVVDAANPENCGWYQITNYVDADNIDIDFKAGAGEYPTAVSSLTWYLMGETYDVPGTDGDLWHLRSQHAQGWEIELKLNDVVDRRIDARVSLNQDWTADGKILGPICVSSRLNPAADPTYTHWYIEGDSGGGYLNLLCLYSLNGTGDSRYLTTFAPVYPWRHAPSHTAAELWALLGSAASTATTDQDRIKRIWTANHDNWSGFYAWRDVPNAQNAIGQTEGSLLEWHKSNASTDGFTSNASREINARSGVNDVLVGSHGILDWSNRKGEFEFIGLLGGHYSARDNLGDMETIDYDGGTDNLIHLGGGVLLPWAGSTPQHTP